MLTHQKVSAILKEAGQVHRGKLLWDEAGNCYLFEREGFGIWGKPGKPVTIEHAHRGHMPENWPAIRTAKTTEYAETLKAAGLEVALCGYNDKLCWLECRNPGDSVEFSKAQLPAKTA